MRRIEKYKNMEIANKRLLKEQWYNPVSWLTKLNKWLYEEYAETLLDFIEKNRKSALTHEQKKEINRLLMEEGIESLMDYIKEEDQVEDDEYDEDWD